MTRKRVELAFVSNDSARKACFKKRKKGFLKKVEELSTLCAVDACAIIYSPYDSNPEVWPNQFGVERVVAQFERAPEVERTRKMWNQESFMKKRVARETEQIKKFVKDNREKDITELMNQCLGGKGLESLSLKDLNDLGDLIDRKLTGIDMRIDESLKEMSTSTPAQVAPLVAPPPPPPPPSADI